jgi:probable F420-dependent oxidoreductase
MRDFRFGFNIRDLHSRTEFLEQCRTAESFGYDVVLVPDHLGAVAPFPALVAAAEATTRMRVGTLVLNLPFWNTHLLAREVATTDRLTDGRLELGLGAGHMKWEFDAAGIEFQPFGERVKAMEEAIAELGRLFAGPDYPEREALRKAFGMGKIETVQRVGFGGSGPPLLIGGTGDRVLRAAARHADIVGHAGVYQVPGKPPGTFQLGTAAAAEERLAFFRAEAGERFDEIESSVLIQAVVVTDDRRGAAEQLVAQHLTHYTPEEALETPFLLIGTHAQIAEQLLERRERFGYSYITVMYQNMADFGPVIELLHGR